MFIIPVVIILCYLIATLSNAQLERSEKTLVVMHYWVGKGLLSVFEKNTFKLILLINCDGLNVHNGKIRNNEKEKKEKGKMGQGREVPTRSDKPAKLFNYLIHLFCGRS